MFNAKKAITEISKFLNGNAWTALNSHVWYKKRCGLVFLRLSNGQSMQLTKSGTTLGTLPAGYRPDYQYDMAGTALGGAESVFFRVNTNGTIIGFASSSTVYWGGLVCFPLVGGGYCLKAVFSRLSAIVERRWRDAECKEGTDKTHAGYVQRRRPIECHRLCKRIPSDTIEKWVAGCESRHRQRCDDSTGYSHFVKRNSHGRADRHHLCGFFRIRVLLRQAGRDLHYRNLQVFTQGGVSCLTGVALSEGGCF